METFPIGREAASPALQCAGPRAHCGREGLGTCACAHHSDARTGRLRLARAEGSSWGAPSVRPLRGHWGAPASRGQSELEKQVSFERKFQIEDSVKLQLLQRDGTHQRQGP